MKKLLILLLGVTLNSCQMGYSPYQTDLPESSKNQTAKQLARLGKSTNPVFSFGLITDSHFHLEDLVNTIRDINNQNVNLAINLGDFTDQGLKFEYETFLSYLFDFNMPFLSVIGNHDAIAYGKELYADMFGEYNFTFEYGGVLWVFFNNNSWEFGSMDLNWLETQLARRSQYADVILVTHIPTNDAERFSPAEISRMENAIHENQVKLHLFGHLHSYNYRQVQSTLHYGMAQTKNGTHDVVEYNNGTITIKRCVHENCNIFITF